jgi:hypothetical protein
MDTIATLAVVCLAVGLAGLVYEWTHETKTRRPKVRRPLKVNIIRPNTRKARRIAKHCAKAIPRTTFSLRATAAAWTAGELSGRAVDAGLIHMPSTNSAKVFLATFGIVLACEALAVGFAEIEEHEEHAPESRPAMIVAVDEKRPSRATPPSLTNPESDPE